MKKLFLLIAALFGAAQTHAQSDITGPNDLIFGGQMTAGVFVQATQGTPSGNANMFPADGKPSFAIDDNFATKYRNFGEFNTGFVVTPGFNFGNGGSAVTKIQFATALDAPERDPLTFVLEGTSGNPLTGSYTLIASGNTGFSPNPGRATSVPPISFPAVGGFTSYRVTFPTVRDSALADSMQIGEIALAGIAAPEPSILSLLGLSALGLLGTRRTRRAKA